MIPNRCKEIKPFSLYAIGFFLFSFTLPMTGQSNIGSWNTYTSFRTVNDLALDASGRVWAATNGGLFNVDVEAGNIERSISTVDGLNRLQVDAMIYDESSNGFWLGYIDGTLQFYNPETEQFTMFTDISRNERFGSKQINEGVIDNDSLYLATGFGVVVWDPENRFVLDSYTRFADEYQAVEVRHVAKSGTNVAVGFQNAVGYASGSSESLLLPSSWTVDESGDNGLSGSINDLRFFDETLLAATTDGVFEFTNGTWTVFQPLTGFGEISNLRSDGNELTAISENHLIQVQKDGSVTSQSLNSYTATDVVIRNGEPLLGTQLSGIVNLSTDESYLPEGPYLNFFDGLNVDNGILISGSSPNPNRVSSPIKSTGFYLFEDGVWSSYNNRTNDIMRQENARAFYKSAVADEYYAFSSWGEGVIIFDKEVREPVIFNNENSSLVGLNSANYFVVVPGIDVDSDQVLWGVSFFNTGDALFRYSHDDQSIRTFSKSGFTNASDFYFGIHIDNYGQKWIPLVGSEQNGRGLLVADLGDLDDTSDDNSVVLGSDINQGFLPDLKVNAMVNDRRGEVWVGTNRGLVRFIFPDRVITGSSNDRRAEYIRSANNDSILFRDANVQALAIDAANQKWMGTGDNGVWLLSENGSRVIHHFTRENSPLTSNIIQSVAVDDNSGLVYIATSDGLFTYAGVTQAPDSEMGRLNVYPNPFVYDSHSENAITLEGLSEATKVRVVTIDGFVVDEFDTRGGRIRWNVSNSRGERLNSGVYFLIAYDSNNEQKGIGKLAVVR